MRKLALGALMLVLHLPVHAAPQLCNGTITELVIWNNGDLAIFPSWRKEWVLVCNLNRPLNDVSPMVCATWYATIREALGKKPLPQTVIYYGDAPACESVPYNALTPAYIMLRQ